MIHPFPHPKPRREPVQAGSGYLNLPLRTEAEVISLRAAREAKTGCYSGYGYWQETIDPVQRPVDTEGAA